ncbi:hypothetical protein K438DRAFT_1844990 [Mycena galopus ATCC 62051]|nr:hypothetical protein K438DRAFT_1877331 [Mycena galopus ATCC 62051]KAF8177957.1 hypothetical protein K438DRAFT_1844990 [Mycena galopus ATCC 62051]
MQVQFRSPFVGQGRQTISLELMLIFLGTSSSANRAPDITGPGKTKRPDINKYLQKIESPGQILRLYFTTRAVE